MHDRRPRPQPLERRRLDYSTQGSRWLTTVRKKRRYRWPLGIGLFALLLTLFAFTWSEAFEPPALSSRLQDAVAQTWRGALNTWRGSVRVGLQIGHENAHEHPDEVAVLRASTGGRANGVNEVDINRAVVAELKRLLEADGIIVDVLPAVVPPGYRADLFVSVHADSVYQTSRRGYKSAHFVPARNAQEPLLKAAIDEAYLRMSGLPDDNRNDSANMRHYYAFNHHRFEYSVDPSTPAVIVEMGYISNWSDLAYIQQIDAPARAIHAGIMNYLREQEQIR